MRTELLKGWSVTSWRREQLAASGFLLPLAAAVASDPGFDIHGLIVLVERGCSPDVAARILAPFDTGTVA